MRVQGVHSHEGSGPSNWKEKGTSSPGTRAWGEEQSGDTLSLCRPECNLPQEEVQQVDGRAWSSGKEGSSWLSGPGTDPVCSLIFVAAA